MFIPFPIVRVGLLVIAPRKSLYFFPGGVALLPEAVRWQSWHFFHKFRTARGTRCTLAPPSPARWSCAWPSSRSMTKSNVWRKTKCQCPIFCCTVPRIWWPVKCRIRSCLWRSTRSRWQGWQCRGERLFCPDPRKPTEKTENKTENDFSGHDRDIEISFFKLQLEWFDVLFLARKFKHNHEVGLCGLRGRLRPRHQIRLKEPRNRSLNIWIFMEFVRKRNLGSKRNFHLKCWKFFWLWKSLLNEH